MRQPNNSQWWLLVVVALLIVFVWPPSDDRSLAVKFVNWAVDPRDELPVLPPQLALGLGDDPDAVTEHDAVTQQYDMLYARGGGARGGVGVEGAPHPLTPTPQRQKLAARRG